MNRQMTNPYVGPRTYRESERDRFFGRDREARELLALTVSERLVLFYAQSGAGKSSLINTTLIPNLKSRGFKVLPIGRVGGEETLGINLGNIYAFNLLRILASKETESATLENL